MRRFAGTGSVFLNSPTDAPVRQPWNAQEHESGVEPIATGRDAGGLRGLDVPMKLA